MAPQTPDRNCAKIIGHLNRIQGQITALKSYLENGRTCEDVSHLTRSILTSFTSVRASILEEMIREELPATRKGGERLTSIVAMYKS